jgi:hypothetical protein
VTTTNKAPDGRLTEARLSSFAVGGGHREAHESRAERYTLSVFFRLLPLIRQDFRTGSLLLNDVEPLVGSSMYAHPLSRSNLWSRPTPEETGVVG